LKSKYSLLHSRSCLFRPCQLNHGRLYNLFICPKALYRSIKFLTLFSLLRNNTSLNTKLLEEKRKRQKLVHERENLSIFPKMSNPGSTRYIIKVLTRCRFWCYLACEVLGNRLCQVSSISQEPLNIHVACQCHATGIPVG
jgi:hypothetical protein